MFKERFLFSLKGLVLFTLMLFLSACAHKSDSDADAKKNTKISAAACAGNAYMQKYGCSLERIQSAAKSGDPDAQYALGYMYYYGIGTVRDMETSRLWIRRAAIQGQPLAKKALALMSTGGGLDSLHGGRRGRSHVGTGGRAYSNTGNSGYDATGVTRRRQARKKRSSSGTSVYDATPNVHHLNTANPDAPISEHLPNYGKKKTTNGAPNSIVNTLKTEPATTDTNGSSHDNNADNAPVEPLTQVPMRRKFTDPRLASNARPMTAKMMKSNRAARRAMPMARLAARRAITATEQTLLRVSADQFTVQLMGGRSIAAMQAFVREHHLAGLTKIYTAKYRNKTWYMLVYGKYSTAMRAHTAVQQMSPNLRSLHPWVKSFRVVHQEIRQHSVA